MTPTRGQWATMAAAVAFLVGAIGYMIGVARATTDPPATDSIDVGFLLDMRSHHEQAIQISLLQMRHGENTTVEGFATDVHYFQGYEIGVMERQLELWGVDVADRPAKAMAWMGHAVAVADMPGLATEAEMDALADARGAAADALFVRLMQDHHRGGVDMAEFAVAHASTPFVRELAGRMARTQALEIKEMEGVLKRDGLDPKPAGWTPGPFDLHEHG